MTVPDLVVLVALLVAATLLVPARRRSADGIGLGDGEQTPVGPTAPTRTWWRATGRLARSGRGAGASGWVADLAEVVAVGLRAGLDLPRAVRVAARSPAVAAAAPWLTDVVDDRPDVVARVAALARESRLDPASAHDLAVLARAWDLAAGTGAAIATTTSAAAGAVRARQEARHRTETALAGPRASMRLLSVLPLGGPFVGLLVGLDPVAMYTSLAARLAAACGIVLTVAGWVWALLLLRRASRPGTTGEPADEPADRGTVAGVRW